MTTDFKIFDDAFVYDIPEDQIGFFMFATTGRPFYFSDAKSMKRELKLAAQYAECHGVKFDLNIVYDELMEIQKDAKRECNVYTGREKEEKNSGYGTA